LDEILARSARVQQGCVVKGVHRAEGAFIVEGIRCAVVIDASGKLGRFTKRRTVEEFGIQYTEPEPRGPVMDFWFFDEGYGGAVSVENGGSNFCFLIQKSALSKYTGRPGLPGDRPACLR
jgi:hypothetical protein